MQLPSTRWIRCWRCAGPPLPVDGLLIRRTYTACGRLLDVYVHESCFADMLKETYRRLADEEDAEDDTDS